jgi:hypothetical protein
MWLERYADAKHETPARELTVIAASCICTRMRVSGALLVRMLLMTLLQ